jgi:hypothetical protein
LGRYKIFSIQIADASFSCHHPVIEVLPEVPCFAFSSPGLVGGCGDGGDPPLICLWVPWYWQMRSLTLQTMTILQLIWWKGSAVIRKS